MRTIVAILLLATLSVPVSSAWNADVLMRMDDPSKFIMEATATLNGDEASELRMQIDSAGNDDGTVQASEVETVEGFFKQFMQQMDEEEADDEIGSTFTIDGQGPSMFQFTTFDLQDAEGAVSSKSPIKAVLNAQFTFPITPGQNHTIRIMGMDNGDQEEEEGADFFEQVESAKFRAASGYVFSSVSGLPEGAKVSGDKREIEFAGSVGPTNGETVIVMSKGGASGGNSPSLAAPALLVSLGLVAFLLRRKA